MVREIFLFPASPPSYMQPAINTKSGSFPVHSLRAAAVKTYHSRNAGPGFQVDKPGIIKLTVPQQKKEWTQVPQNEDLLPKGCSVVPPKEIWMQTFHKFPGDEVQNTIHHSDVGWHLRLRIIPVAHVLDTHRKSITHLPAELLLCLSLTLAFFAFFL